VRNQLVHLSPSQSAVRHLAGHLSRTQRYLLANIRNGEIDGPAKII